MNKRQIMELIDRMFELGYTCPYETTKLFVREYEKLNEPQKAKIPQVIAEYIEQKKNEDYHLLGAMDEIRSHKNKEIDEWFYTDDNIEIFARAWLDGYEVENRYRVKMKGIVNALSFLSYHKKADIWTVTDINNSNGHRTHHTRKELEDAGFGWVFDCKGIQIEEVEK